MTTTTTMTAPKLHQTVDTWDARATMTAPRMHSTTPVRRVGELTAVVIAFIVIAFIMMWPFTLGQG